MNYLDIIISICLLYGIVRGFSNGIIIEISNIISVFLAIYLGIHFSEFIYPYLSLDRLSDYSNIIPLVSFLIVFIIIIIIIKSLGELINKITNQLALGIISKLLGAIFGMIKILLISMFLLLLAVEYNLIKKQTKEKSVLYGPIKKASKTIVPEIKKHKKTIIKTAKENTEKAKQAIEDKINP